MYPKWVEKYHTEGTSIKEKNGNYYLYKVSSKRVKGKKYPVSVQKYIGKITEESLIEPDRVYFTPGVDKVIHIVELCNKIMEKDLEILSKIYVIKIDEDYYCGNLSTKEISVIKRYLNIENNKIWR